MFLLNRGRCYLSTTDTGKSGICSSTFTNGGYDRPSLYAQPRRDYYGCDPNDGFTAKPKCKGASKAAKARNGVISTLNKTTAIAAKRKQVKKVAPSPRGKTVQQRQQKSKTKVKSVNAGKSKGNATKKRPGFRSLFDYDDDNEDEFAGSGGESSDGESVEETEPPAKKKRAATPRPRGKNTTTAAEESESVEENGEEEEQEQEQVEDWD